MIVLLFGPPGCGKGTQASFIASRYHIPAISTGEVLRAECKAGTPLGKQACAILASGGLVGDDIVNQVVANRVSHGCESGFLLDGYPRTVAQARFLDQLTHRLGLPEPTVIHLDVPGDVIVSRITARRQCPSCSRIYNLISQPPQKEGVCDFDGAALVRREDDTEAVIRARLKAYQEQTGPVIAFYPRRWTVDGNRAPCQITADLELLLGMPVHADATAR